MTGTAPIRLLLGPQRPTINLADAIATAGLPEGPLAVIAAGWQEAEVDIDDVQAIVDRPVENLRLYHRAEEVFAADAGLAAAHRARQDRLQEQQRLYRLRLSQLAVAARHVLRAEGAAEMLVAEQRHAIAQLRALDRHHLYRTEAIHAEFAAAHDPATNPLLAGHAAEVFEIIGRASAILITGGNVPVLINRMRLFGLGNLMRDRHVVAWSAGAMVLAERIVLFHDRMPQGRRDPEILGSGLGIVPGFVFLPDPARRLRDKDRLRIGLMSRRFAPDTCVALDSGAALHLDGSAPRGAQGVKRLNRKGRLVRLKAA